MALVILRRYVWKIKVTPYMIFYLFTATNSNKVFLTCFLLKISNFILLIFFLPSLFHWQVFCQNGLSFALLLCLFCRWGTSSPLPFFLFNSSNWLKFAKFLLVVLLCSLKCFCGTAHKLAQLRQIIHVDGLGLRGDCLLPSIFHWCAFRRQAFTTGAETENFGFWFIHFFTELYYLLCIKSK